jgi:chemotaxis methyl-accepting protein methylase
VPAFWDNGLAEHGANVAAHPPSPPRSHSRLRLAPRAEGSLDEFLVWLLQKAWLSPEVYRASALHRRLPACLRALRVPTTAAARALLEREPQLLSRALSTILIGVSGFFREPLVFEILQREGLPRLLRRTPELRVLSAGCSDGQELYSLAMLLDQAGALDKAFLLGLDCRSEAVVRAQGGWFEVAEIGQVPLEFHARYFTHHGSEVLVSRKLRERICWCEEDLLAGLPEEQEPACVNPPCSLRVKGKPTEHDAHPTLAPLPEMENRNSGLDYFESATGFWDLILFRNVAIYLDPHPAQSLWARLVRQLRVGGLLVTGKAERPPRNLPVRRIGHCLYERIND